MNRRVYTVRREGMIFDDDFVAAGSWLIEGDEQQVNIHRQAVHSNHFFGRRPDHFCQRVLHHQIWKSSWELTVEMRKNSPVIQSNSFLSSSWMLQMIKKKWNVHFGPRIEDVLNISISFLRFQAQGISTEVNNFLFSINSIINCVVQMILIIFS